jgi:predicted XRE-type DNA-binding protein
MDNEIMRARFAQVVKKILADRDLSQQQLADRYLNVSQACIRDYVGGEKTSPTQVRLITMIKIAELYGCTVDGLYHYLRTGRWKRGISVTDVEGYIRSIADPKILLAIMALAQNILEQKIDALNIPVEQEKFNPSTKLIALIEHESAKVESPYQWETLLRAFEISEEDIEDLYIGQLPTLELLMKFSKVFRMDIDALTNLLECPAEATSIAECSQDDDCSDPEEPSPPLAEAEVDVLFQRG